MSVFPGFPKKLVFFPKVYIILLSQKAYVVFYNVSPYTQPKSQVLMAFVLELSPGLQAAPGLAKLAFCVFYVPKWSGEGRVPGTKSGFSNLSISL